MIINKKAWIMAEVMAAIAVLAVIMVTLAATIRTFGKFNDFHLQKQRCLASAQAQIDSINLTGSPLPKSEFEKLWPNVKTSTSISDGKDQWQGLKLVKAISTATARGRKKPVTVELGRYILTRSETK